MHNRTRELLDYLDLHRAALRDAVNGIRPEHHSVSPGDERWSVLQILDHLRIVETQIAGLCMKLTEPARAANAPRETDDSPILHTLKLDRVVSREVRIKSPATVQPSAPADASSAFAALDTSREKLRAAVHAGDGLALRTFSFPHPALGVLDLYEWIGFVGAHEARHTDQIREAGAFLSGAA